MSCRQLRHQLCVPESKAVTYLWQNAPGCRIAKLGQHIMLFLQYDSVAHASVPPRCHSEEARFPMAPLAAVACPGARGTRELDVSHPPFDSLRDIQRVVIYGQITTHMICTGRTSDRRRI
jgi:hypothetical protein